MPVDTVGGDVQHAVFEPLDRDIAEGEIDVLYLGEGGHPVEPLALLGPEGLRVADRVCIKRLVLARGHMWRVCCTLFGRCREFVHSSLLRS